MTTWESKSADVVLHNCDSCSILRDLDTSRCVLFTDPPYGISYKSDRGASWSGVSIENDNDTAARDAAVGWACAGGIPWVVFGTWNIPPPASTRGVLIWDKGPSTGMGDLSFPWKKSFEIISVGGPGWQGHRGEGVLRGHIVVSSERWGRTHPNEKPTSLVVDILRKLPIDVDRVVDPFMGTGSVGVAAARLRLGFVGVELNSGYYGIARRRISECLHEDGGLLDGCALGSARRGVGGDPNER